VYVIPPGRATRAAVQAALATGYRHVDTAARYANEAEDTVRFCQQAGIAVEAWAPLARGYRLRHPTLRTVAAEVGPTPAQVLVRWSLQKGFVAVPRSTDPRHIAGNANVFDFALDDSQIAARHARRGTDDRLGSGLAGVTAPDRSTHSNRFVR
jgi:diketogulonate reductase-like aldo/keto reductase